MKTTTKHNQLSYLERLTFDPKLLTGFVSSYISNIRFVILLTLVIAIMGMVSYFNLPQRLNPEIHIPIVTVVTALPGAGPDDVEKLVTIPLEDKLRGLSGLDTISSVSQENVSVITMQFYNSVTPEKARSDSKDAVDTVTTLPSDALDPQVNALDFENEPVWQFALTSKNDPISLFSYSKKLEDEIKDLPDVDKVSVRGRETQVIAIDVIPEKVAEYNINPLALSQALKVAVSSYPAGTIETPKNAYSLTIDPAASSIEDIRALRIDVDGASVRLGDIADVTERSAANQTSSYLATSNEVSKRSVTFSVYKRSTSDIVKTADAVRAVVEKSIASSGDRYALTSILNTGDLIRDQFVDLLGEFRSTVLLVFATLFIFLGLRQATISAVTVPLTFLSAFVLMRMFGMSVNFLSLFAFLLSLGLLIDDTIVVVSAMTAYYKTGKFTPKQTGLLVWRDTIVPIWSTTITTIWSFVPLLLSTGIIGEFIKPIPVVVTVTMISSTAIAVLITLPIMIILLKPNIARRVVVLAKILGGIGIAWLLISIIKGNPFFAIIIVLYAFVGYVYWNVKPVLLQRIRTISRIPVVVTIHALLTKYASHGLIDVTGFAKRYERFITRILNSPSARKRVIFIIVVYSIVSFLLLPLGLVKNEFFPKSDGDVVYVNMELPSGTTLSENTQKTTDLLERFRKVKGSEFVVADVGTSKSSMIRTSSDQMNTTLFTFHLPAKSKRTISSMTIADELRAISKTYSGVKLSVLEESSGPPAGADLQLKLSGDDLTQLNALTDTIAAYLKKQQGIVNVEKSIKSGTSAIIFVPDANALAQHGIKYDSLGFWLRTAASGFTLDSVSFDANTTEKTDVVFSFGRLKQSPETISRLMVPTAKGSVPLSALGHFEAKANPTLITREEGKRTMSVSAGVIGGYSVSDLNTKLLEFSKTIQLPEGYAWKTGGVNQENEKSVQSILQAMVVAFLLILVTMVIQFQSYRQAIIVLLVIPLAVSSVFIVFALTGTPLSFPALIGVLSLFGIVVTNSMFIVDKININIREGMPFVRAIADAGGSRMEPIILTKLCTVFGLLPITIADPLWRGLGGAIISGILLASTIMLLFIPVVYYTWMNPDKE